MSLWGSVIAAVAAIGFADPFVGTSGDGHATPAAAVPFGMVQPGPDTGIGKWSHTSGYQGRFSSPGRLWQYVRCVLRHEIVDFMISCRTVIDF